MHLKLITLTVGSVVVMASGCGPESPHSISDVTKDPFSACGVRDRKILCF